MPYTIKRNDSKPLVATLRERRTTGPPILLDPVNDDVIFTMRPIVEEDRPALIITGACTILDTGTEGNEDQGKVRYDWQAGDTDVASVYHGEFRIDYGDGVTQHVPNDSYEEIVVLGGLD